MNAEKLAALARLRTPFFLLLAFTIGVLGVWDLAGRGWACIAAALSLAVLEWLTTPTPARR